MTTLTITPTADVDCKRADLVGCIAVREQVAVTLAGLGDRVSEGLVLRILSGTSIMASCEEWTATGEGDIDAAGTLDLNTDVLIAFMATVRAHTHRTFALSVWSIEDQEVIIDEPIQILSTPVDASESAPTPLAPWGTDLSDIQADITALEAAMAAHDHDGSDSAHVAHGELTAGGTITHAAIEAALANLQVDLNAHADRLALLEAWRLSATALLAAAGDAITVIQQWKASATADLGALQTAAGNLQAQITALGGITQTSLGWNVATGTELRDISENPTYGNLIKVVRTLCADLKGRGVI
jgi:hypothetical protein